MNYTVKQLLKSKIIPAILSVAVGILVIVFRKGAMDVILKIMGGLVIAGGLGFIAIYLTRPEKDAGNLKMVLCMALTSVVIGVLLIIFAPDIVEFFPKLMGVLLILNGLSHLTTAWVDKENRILITIMAVLIILMGLVIIFNPAFIGNLMIIFIGASFIVNGLFDILVIYKVRDTLN